jgi:hypothetical protein
MIRVTDHALVRFVERVGGLDVEALRCALAASLARASAAASIGQRRYTVLADGVAYVVVDGVLVTVIDGPVTHPHDRPEPR